MIVWLTQVFSERRIEGARELGFKALLGLAMTAGLLFADPLEIGSRTERHSRDVFNAIFGVPAATTPTAGDVAVVVLNETTLRALGMPWPLPYAVHADIVDAIRSYAPKALVVDILFVDPLRRDPTVSELADTLRAEGRAKVFLASAPGGGTAILPALDPAGWGEASDRAELVAVDEVPPDFAHSPYKLLRDTGPDSPAFSVYRHLCAHGEMAGCGRTVARADFRWDMEIQWPIGAPDPRQQMRLIGRECAAVPEGWFARLGAVLRAAGGLEGLRQSCPPYTAVLAQDLLRPGRHEEILDAALRGKVVFYGVSITGNTDAVRVGHVKEPLPGVFVHAAAYENLARYGTRYLTGSPRSERISETAVELTLAAAMAMLVFLGTRGAQLILVASKGQFGLPPLMKRIVIVWPLFLGLALAGAALCGGAVLIEYHLFAIAPSNWIALLTMSTATLAMIEPAIKSG